jgi:hypothetical protein
MTTSLASRSEAINMTLTRKKVHVSIQISNGSHLQGTMIIERDTRLSDVFNNLKKDFIVVTDNGYQPHIVNKRHIIQIMELPDEPNDVDNQHEDSDDDYLELPET